MSNDLKRLIVDHRDEKQELIRELLENGTLKRRKRASKVEISHAYRYVLETGESATGAILEVARVLDKGDDWADTIKHSPVYKNIVDYSIKTNKDHPVFKLMEQTGVWHTGTKRSLRESTTLSSLLNNLSKNVGLATRLAHLEGLLEHEVPLPQQEIKGNKDKMVSENEEKALLLLKDGYTIAEVSEMMGIHRNTISKYKRKR